MADTSYLANVPDETIQAGIEMWERHVLVEPNDTSNLMKEIKKRLKEYKAEAKRRAVLAQKPANDSGAAVHLCTFKEVTTDNGIKQRGVWIDRNGADVLYIHASDVSALQAENARLQRELEAARTAVADLLELGRDVKAEVAKLWSPNDQSQVRRDYRMITETLNEIDALLEEVVDDENTQPTDHRRR